MLKDLQLPIFANAYLGASILCTRKHPGRINMVSHVARDIINRLAFTHLGTKTTPYYPNRDLIDLAQKWNYQPGPLPQPPTEPPVEQDTTSTTISLDLYKETQDILEQVKEGHLIKERQDSIFFEAFLEYADPGLIPSNINKIWEETRDWFLEHTHLNKKQKLDSVCENDLVKHFTNLEDILFIAATNSVSNIKKLDEILEDTNS